MAIFELFKQQDFPVKIEQVWDFISSPQNLKVITPDYMGFEITSSHLVDKIYPGLLITYKVSPLLKFKITWVTEITHVEYLKYFVDEQRRGPYKIWHHEHRLVAIKGGTRMTDLITYEPPLGFLGALANKFLIRNKLEKIFDYRENVLNKIFSSQK